MDAQERQNYLPRILSAITMSRAVPFLVLIISLIMTYVIWFMLDAGFNKGARRDFKDKAAEIVFQINEVLRDHEQVLRGGVGLFNANGTVTREQWRCYVSSLQFNRVHPGINGIGYAAWLNLAEKESHVRKIRAQGFPEYRIRPQGERPFYAAITYLEPSTWPNRLAFGLDMYSEINRRWALDRSKNKGVTTITGGVSLATETDQGKQPGVLMYLPVYRAGAPVTGREVRGVLKGFVFSPIRIKEFVHGALVTFPTDIAFEIFDGDASRSVNPLFSTLKSEKISLPDTYKPELTSSQTMGVCGRNWTITFKSLPAFDGEFHRSASRMALATGILVSILLAAITYALQTTRDRALSLARGMTQDLCESEETVRLILDTVGEAIYGVDMSGCCTFCNPAGLKLLGYQKEELLGKNMHDLVTHPPSDSTASFPGECSIGRVMETNTACHMDDTLFRRGDGTSFAAEYWAVPKCKEGRVIGAVVSFMDIIERKRNETVMKEQAEELRQEITERRAAQKGLLYYQQRLEEMNQALEDRVVHEVCKNQTKEQLLMQQEKMASIGQLAAGVAHEINIPLTFITSNIRTLAGSFDLLVQGNVPRGEPTTDETSISLGHVLSNGADLIAQSLAGTAQVTKIVQDLKSFSRIDVPEYELVAPTACLESALTMVHHEMKHLVTIRREYVLVPDIHCHPGQLNQLFLILLINARQAIIPPGEITLRSWHDDAFVYLSVSDTGQGISEEILGKIFEPFFTTRDVGQGIGLGLSIAHEIVGNHDGTILVASEVGKGAIFTVILPLA